MKKVIFCFNMPQKGYFGGIATIIKNYMENRSIFNSYDTEIELFDYRDKYAYKIGNQKVRNIYLAHKQRKAAIKLLKKQPQAIFHIHTSRNWLFFKDVLMAYCIKKKLTNSVGITVHFADINKILYRNRLLSALELKWLSKLDFIIVLSKKTKSEFVEHGVPKEKISVLYTFHCYNTNCLSVSRNEPIRLLYMGSIDKRKGILDLLEVLTDLQHEFKLDICGSITDYSIENNYRQLINKLGDSIIEHGYVSGKEKETILENADILILPSYGEGMPIVIMEAYAKACAVISTKIAAIPEVVHPDNGILIEPGDKADLRRAILSFIEDGRELVRIKNNNISESQKYSVGSNIKSMCLLYNSLIDGKQNESNQ